LCELWAIICTFGNKNNYSNKPILYINGCKVGYFPTNIHTFFIFSFIKSAFLYNFAIKECDITIVLK